MKLFFKVKQHQQTFSTMIREALAKEKETEKRKTSGSRDRLHRLKKLGLLEGGI